MKTFLIIFFVCAINCGANGVRVSSETVYTVQKTTAVLIMETCKSMTIKEKITHLSMILDTNISSTTKMVLWNQRRNFIVNPEGKSMFISYKANPHYKALKVKYILQEKVLQKEISKDSGFVKPGFLAILAGIFMVIFTIFKKLKKKK